jgi:hypothetical protein
MTAGEKRIKDLEIRPKLSTHLKLEVVNFPLKDRTHA